MNFWGDFINTFIVVSVILFGIVFAIVGCSKRIKRYIARFWNGDDEL